MSEIRDVRMGYVTDRRGARLHLVISGRPYCGAGSGIVLSSRPAHSDDGPRCCGRCRIALTEHLADARNIRARRGSPGDLAIAASCEALIEALTTQAERVERAQMLDTIRENLMSPEVPPTPNMPTSPQGDDDLTLF